MEDSTSQALTATPALPSALSAPTSAQSATALVPVPASSVPDAASATIPAPEPVASVPVREDQVQNAVGFLSHPQVRSSTNTASKRSFLERKSLNAAEIDEAFRRVPEAPAATAPAQVALTLANASPQPAPAPAPQPIAYANQLGQAYAPATNAAGLQLVAGPPPAQMGALVPQATPGYRWSQVVLGVGVVFAAGWAVHQVVVPRLRSLVDSWQAHRREAEEARHKDLTTAVERLKGCQEELKVSTQALLEAVTLMRDQQRALTLEGVVPTTTRGMPAGRPNGTPSRDTYPVGNGRNDNPYNPYNPYSGNTLGAENFAALRAAAGYTNAYPPDPPSYSTSYNYGRGESGPSTAGPTGGEGNRSTAGMYGEPNPLYSSVRTSPPNSYGRPASGGEGVQQHQESLSYRVTAPPSPANSIHSLQSSRQHQATGAVLVGSSGPYGSSDRLYEQSGAAGAKAASGNSPSAGGGGVYGGGGSSDVSGADGLSVPRPAADQPEYPQSFHEVMEMVQQGRTPPNVRTDINDAPPDPTRPLSEPRMVALPKPWERAASASDGSGSSSTAAPSGTPYSALMSSGRSNGMPYNWGASSQPDQSILPGSSSLPTTVYSMPSSASVSGAAAGASISGPAAGSSSNAGAGAGSNGKSLSFLPPANPAWRPPPPPIRTITSSIPASPLGPYATGPTGGSGEASAGGVGFPVSDAAPAAPGAMLPESGAALAGPPSPTPSQPALAASASELVRALEAVAASSTAAGDVAGPSAASAGPPPTPLLPPPPLAAVLVQAADASQIEEVTTPSGASAPATSSP